ncbi:flagellar hook-basal body complex protein FliE [Campylobacter insulaenigrae]|uniref:Flagellar hook-basal body complex protein FliE n=1 Tax=Campylobacter insulaenigrae TaxID=260714 RepID=A0ABY3G3L3_9BACT|nr:flagellar hook-basal body complex protein FliE [Campylobacter insulaenigrae]MCR6571192.1 flagellar hook-basal body complex protein FliE [Campylobacter insulaenigrae]MCR6571626.1 flagellar hook-basal body complex protein FliE [Campylobacter insulaenigrae]MCR6574267.1 flagellar hook-basal body complex protein FliE [Campylobacter insulaenigrae]MCR6575937.1 flagellar hook-basal body complex protein FliE [Campylobacter insulaenigrae]MCR6577234.1 flagellar hook-basal body complex protein FliE [Ca
MNNINQLNNLNNKTNSTNTNSIGNEFSSLLKNSINDLNKNQEDAEAAMTDIATGEVKDLHQAAIAISKAETSMKFMLEVRNKAINAYKEISRTQI